MTRNPTTNGMEDSTMDPRLQFIFGLVRAHQDATGTPIPRRVLLSLVSEAAGQQDCPFSRRDLPRTLMALLADLHDQNILVTTSGGLHIPVDAP